MPIDESGGALLEASLYIHRVRNPSYSSRIADKISSILEERHISKKEFAKGCNVQNSVVTTWLTGRHNFTINTLQVIADFLLTDIITITKN